MAALLAEQQFLATREFLTAKDGGLYNTYTNGGRPTDATADLGSRWELEQIALRLWPSASSIQGLNTAMFDLTEGNNINPGQVKSVRVSLSDPTFNLHGNFRHYKGKFEALLSAHYSAAVILHDKTLTLAQFEPARYEDANLRQFAAEQVQVKADPALSGVQSTVEIETIDGKTISAKCEHPRGSFENPLSREQIESKFETYASARLSTSATAEVIAAVQKLENVASLRKLMNALRESQEQRQDDRAA